MTYKHSISYHCFCVFALRNPPVCTEFIDETAADLHYQGANVIEYRVYRRCCEDRELKIVHCPVCRAYDIHNS